MNDQETKNIVEAMEQWKKMHEIKYTDIVDYVRIPKFSDIIKEKIFDIVRKIGINNSKAEIEYLFTSEEYQKAKCEYDIRWIMMDIDHNAFNSHSFHTDFMEEFDSLVRGEFDIVNPEFAYEDCFQNAYIDSISDYMGDIENEWLDERITLEEWKNLLMSVAQ